ncbi:MAG: NADH-quinone oxidoreductase subunit NuoE [Alphaproteobacteria bacterium]|nr:NADH-quinone oxidoreductase subunit NuoE [Alphaproteobacteria bacterium]
MTSNPLQKTFTFDKAFQEQVQFHLSKYPVERKASAVIPLLDLAQRQLGGSISQEAVEHVAEILSISPMRVLEVASFYTMLNLDPVGKHHVQVCTTTPCWLRGSDAIMETCRQTLGLQNGEVSQDGKFSLMEVECLGACVNAPMVQINDDYYEDLTPETMKKLLEDLAKDKQPSIGPQLKRQTSAPISGPKTCLENLKDKTNAIG